jgi:hypothetical protein
VLLLAAQFLWVIACKPTKQQDRVLLFLTHPSIRWSVLRVVILF